MSVAITLSIPGLLTRFTDGQRAIEVEGDTITEVVERTVERYPDLEPHLFDGAGQLRAHLVICRNGRPVELGGAASIELDFGDKVAIIQAVSGG